MTSFVALSDGAGQSPDAARAVCGQPLRLAAALAEASGPTTQHLAVLRACTRNAHGGAA